MLMASLMSQFRQIMARWYRQIGEHMMEEDHNYISAFSKSNVGESTNHITAIVKQLV